MDNRVVDISNSEQYSWGQKAVGWHLLKAGNLSVISEKMPKGAAERMHYHEKTQQFFYVLSGEATFEVNGAIHVVKQHQGIAINPGEKHKVTNFADQDLEIMVISSQPSHGDRINLE